jgi:TolB protein
MAARSDRSAGWARTVALATVMVLVATGCAITRVSVSSTGTEGNWGSAEPRGVTDDGRYVLFASLADNLVDSDTNDLYDVFRHDAQTGATVRVSVAGNGAQLPTQSFFAAMTPNGRYVAFINDTAIDPADTNGQEDVYVRDLVAGTTQWASQPPPGGFPGGRAGSPEISTGGRFVSFLFTAGGSNPLQLWRRDRLLGTTVALSEPGLFEGVHASRDAHHYAVKRGCAFAPGCGPIPLLVDADGSASGWPPLQFAPCRDDEVPALSPDGRHLVWFSANQSGSPDCLPRGWYLVDRATGVASPLDLPGSFDPPSGPNDIQTQVLALSRDGRAVLYTADGAAIPGGTEGRRALYVREVVNHSDRRLDMAITGEEAGGQILNAVLSDDGTYVAFATDAGNLIPDDQNGDADVFVRKTGIAPSP